MTLTAVHFATASQNIVTSVPAAPATPTGNRLMETLQSRWEQLRPQVAQAAEKSQDAARETFDKTLHQASEHLNSEALRPISERVKSGVNQGLEKTEQANQALAGKAQALLSDPLQQWLAAHPLWHWALDHPLFAIVGSLLSLIFLFNLLKLLLSPKMWLWILGLPVRLVARLLAPKASQASTPPAAVTSSASLLSSAPSTVASNTPGNQAEINRILARLQALQQEQSELQQQLKALLIQPPTQR